MSSLFGKIDPPVLAQAIQVISCYLLLDYWIVLQPDKESQNIYANIRAGSPLNAKV